MLKEEILKVIFLKIHQRSQRKFKKPSLRIKFTEDFLKGWIRNLNMTREMRKLILMKTIETSGIDS